MSKTYNQGKLDSIEKWGKVCSRYGDCNECPIGVLKGEDVTCPQFASKFPEKFVSVLDEIESEDFTYYNEYCLRFPASEMTLDEISTALCRKTVFEGDFECESENCLECWNRPYRGDKEESDT